MNKLMNNSNFKLISSDICHAVSWRNVVRNISHKDWQLFLFFFFFFSKETFLVYPTLTILLKERKTYDANDLFRMNYYYLGKKFYYTYLKTAEHEMLMSYAKLFNEEMREQLVKMLEKRKKYM